MDICDAIFDLDGTLVDSMPGIQQSANYAASTVLTKLAIPDLTRFIGPPIREVLCKALGDSARPRAIELERCFRSHYDEIGWQQTQCYPGAVEVLRELDCRGIRCYVVTNKPLQASMQILARLRLGPWLTGVVTRDSRSPEFESKADALDHLVRRFKISSEQAVMVGDSSDDGIAARANRMAFVAAGYGYGSYSGLAYSQDLPTPTFTLTSLSDLLTLMPVREVSNRAANAVVEVRR
jgi:phosphoglycolate phosphatase